MQQDTSEWRGRCLVRRADGTRLVVVSYLGGKDLEQGTKQQTWRIMVEASPASGAPEDVHFGVG